MLLVFFCGFRCAGIIPAKKRAKLHKKNEMGKKMSLYKLLFMFFCFHFLLCIKSLCGKVKKGYWVMCVHWLACVILPHFWLF